MNIAIFGGSFNPVHLDHITIANKLVDELNLDKLYIMPTFVAPHKRGDSVVSGADRLQMLKLAFENNDKIIVSNYELEKGGISYSYQTVEHIYNALKPTNLYFIVGSDMLDNFPTWKYPEKILSLATLVLVERRNGEFDDEKSIAVIKSKFNKTVKKVQVYGETISSTKIRVYKKLGLPLDDMLPFSVEKYLLQNDLYLEDSLYSYVKLNLPLKRRYHVAGVIILAVSLAKKLGVDTKKAEISALLHDIAKYENPDNVVGFIYDKDMPKDIIHQYLGEYIARTKLGVYDEEVLLAIKYHTTGRPNMTLLEKIIYVADIIEPSRKFAGVEPLREEVKKDFDRGFKICLEEIVEFLIEGGGEVYPLTLDALNYYKEN
ncbi:MAG: nicotinate (nicotinamide) nucleotide adenylyltransferase [Clostridia bacterium]|nr:nicotinate (nicotinamide) nucleotide adenylyltransferase [Clostridia bacterium]